MPFVIVGLAVLFLRLDDGKAWLLALIFTGMATTPAFPDSISAFAPAFRPFTRLYQGILIGFFAPLFYVFFAVFPAPSSLDRRVPWLKWVALATGAAVAVAGVRTGAIQLPPPLPRLLGQDLASQIAMWWLLGLLTLGMVSLAANFVHAPDEETRRKIRVIFWGTVVAPTPNRTSSVWRPAPSSATGSRTGSRPCARCSRSCCRARWRTPWSSTACSTCRC